MALVTLRKVSLAFGGPPLLDGVDLAIEPGERLCLLGRNGTGKTTLLKLLAGELAADDGELARRQGLRTAFLPQEVPRELDGAVFEVVASGLGENGRRLAEARRITERLEDGHDGALLARYAEIQHALDEDGAWPLAARIAALLSHMALSPDEEFAALSGGMKRRALLARALIGEPNLLLLDEPTNHLDIDGIRWLEEFLHGFNGTLLFVTHDRAFLQGLATRIVELDRGRLASWPGDYATYLARRQAALDAEAAAQGEFDRRLAREEAWIRQGIKARRTRNEGRVRALEKMRAERRARRARSGTAALALHEAERSGRLVVEAQGISYGYPERAIVRDFSTAILRGDRVGIIGANGSGKTTLIRLLLGELAPHAGTVRHGTHLEVVYFDQMRAQLDEEKSVLDNVAEGRSHITLGGRSQHAIGYLQDFLFTPERVRQPVKALSGGERNRLLLARLFTKPANVLVMDEPTNDLDIETLELLEELLLDFSGTLLLVSHDRAFLNNVVTSTLVLEGNGAVGEYVGNYDDWLRQRRAGQGPQAAAKAGSNKRDNPPAAAPRASAPHAPEDSAPRLRRPSYKERQELAALPARIEALETEQQALHARLADPAFYKSAGEAVAAAKRELEALERALAEAYQRWQELESAAPNTS